MREILFRGKRVDNGEWVQGFYFVEAGHFIKEPPSCVSTSTYLVLPETICQYTDLTDKNGVQIFEGDVVTGLFLYALPINGCVGFREGAFGLHWMRGGWEEFTPFTSMCHVEFEIIGNIHDNPELMGGGNNDQNEPLRQA